MALPRRRRDGRAVDLPIRPCLGRPEFLLLADRGPRVRTLGPWLEAGVGTGPKRLQRPGLGLGRPRHCRGLGGFPSPSLAFPFLHRPGTGDRTPEYLPSFLPRFLAPFFLPSLPLGTRPESPGSGARPPSTLQRPGRGPGPGLGVFRGGTRPSPLGLFPFLPGRSPPPGRAGLLLQAGADPGGGHMGRLRLSDGSSFPVCLQGHGRADHVRGLPGAAGEGGREGEREGGREGRREEGRKEGRKGGREGSTAFPARVLVGPMLNSPPPSCPLSHEI
ncbi:hypothetical protein Naga_101088g1 [Nannochloropsis gaditana]|uniref:Uncharacterized protein n=1 Tax=Nannochloropsis gaditana TaxID=72520 RepID=W7T2H9_9STRA|nr:hypothetical protein Naga_101088g1 [Nannochloropsis gaditana]